MYVYLVNEMKKEFVDKCAGKEIRIPPGQAAKVPDYVAYHFIGDPKVINGEDELEAAAENKRVAMRYAAFKPEDRDKKVPRLRIEPIKEEEIQLVDLREIEAKKIAQVLPQEEEFPQFKKEVEVKPPVIGGTPQKKR